MLSTLFSRRSAIWILWVLPRSSVNVTPNDSSRSIRLLARAWVPLVQLVDQVVGVQGDGFEHMGSKGVGRAYSNPYGGNFVSSYACVFIRSGRVPSGRLRLGLQGISLPTRKLG